MLKKYSDLSAGILFIIIAVLIAVQLPSIKITQIAMTSKLMPQICMYLLLTFGIMLIIKWMFFWMKRGQANGMEEDGFTKQESKYSKKSMAPYLRVILCLVLFGIFIAILRPIGFVLAGIFYLLSTFFILVPKGYHKKTVYVISIISPIVVYLLFTQIFNVILPTGTIW